MRIYCPTVLKRRLESAKINFWNVVNAMILEQQEILYTFEIKTLAGVRPAPYDVETIHVHLVINMLHET